MKRYIAFSRKDTDSSILAIKNTLELIRGFLREDKMSGYIFEFDFENNTATNEKFIEYLEYR
jgi:hypothetical protein